MSIGREHDAEANSKQYIVGKVYEAIKDALEVKQSVLPEVLITVNQLKQNTIKQIEKSAGTKIYDSMLVLCLGTALEKFRADNVGPLVGTILTQKKHIEGISVYGTMEDPIDGQNINDKLKKIYNKHPHAFTITVDCTSSPYESRIGYINVNNEKTRPGDCFGKEEQYFEIKTDFLKQDDKKSKIQKSFSQRPLAFGDVGIMPIMYHQTPKDSLGAILLKMGSASQEYVERMATVTALGLYEALKDVTERGVVLIKQRSS